MESDQKNKCRTKGWSCDPNNELNGSDKQITKPYPRLYIGYYGLDIALDVGPTCVSEYFDTYIIQ